MPGWIGNQAEAPPPGSAWKAEQPELELFDLTPMEMPELWPPRKTVTGRALCQHCLMVVDEPQAWIEGPVIDTKDDPRYDGRPLIAHQCKQARSLVYLYVDG